MSTENLVNVDLIFGHSELRPHGWVEGLPGYFGLVYVHINYDREGNEVSRKFLQPACWLTYET